MGKIVNEIKINLKIILIILLIALIINLWMTYEIFASNDELTEIESKQLKILYLSKLLEEHPNSSVEIKTNLDIFQKGLEFYQQGDFQQAILSLSTIPYTTLNIPLYIKSQFLLGEGYKKVGDFNKAVNIYQNLAEKDPLLTDYSLFYLADTFHLKGDISQAIEIYRKIIIDYPQSIILPQVNYQIASLYLELKELDSALVYFKNSLEISKDGNFKAMVLLELSRLYWQEKNFLAALDCLYAILEEGYSWPRGSEPEELLVRYFFELQENKEEIKLPYPIMVKCADILFKYRRYRQAEDLYTKIIETFPQATDLGEIYYKWARSLYFQKEYEATLNLCEDIIRLFSTNRELRIKADYFGANSLLALGERDEAIKRYQKIIDGYKEGYYVRQAYLRLAETYFRSDERTRGISLWKELIEKYPHTDEAAFSLWSLARLYIQEEKDTEALVYFQKLSEDYDNTQWGDDALFWTGKILKEIGSKEEAKVIFERLIQKYPLSYYAERAIQLEDNLNFPWFFSIPLKENFINLEDFLQKYGNIKEKTRLSLLKAEIFEEIGFYRESILELREALNHDAGNLSLLFRLSEAYKKNQDYYTSLSFTEIVFKYAINNQLLNEMPLELWRNLYPVYFEELIAKYALQYQVDPLLVLAMIREESRFNSWNESVAGARGLMQIIFSTGEWIAQKLGWEDFSDEMLFSPEININLGCWYVKYLQERFQNNLILIISGYNAGPGITSRWLDKYTWPDEDSFIEEIPYSETREHVKKVMKSYLMYQRLKIVSD